MDDTGHTPIVVHLSRTQADDLLEEVRAGMARAAELAFNTDLDEDDEEKVAAFDRLVNLAVLARDLMP